MFNNFSGCRDQQICHLIEHLWYMNGRGLIHYFPFNSYWNVWKERTDTWLKPDLNKCNPSLSSDQYFAILDQYTHLITTFLLLCMGCWKASSTSITFFNRFLYLICNRKGVIFQQYNHWLCDAYVAQYDLQYVRDSIYLVWSSAHWLCWGYGGPIDHKRTDTVMRCFVKCPLPLRKRIFIDAN